MRYHIQTAPIWDAFKENDACPLCKLYARTEQRLVKQYTGEAVMEPDYRVRVNERGFCARHLSQLFNGDNKLGVALQVNTRTEKIISDIDFIENSKKAKKLADKLATTLDTCVICDEVDSVMERYFYTIAQMYDNEAEFPKLLKESQGFCLPHFIELLRFVSYAGKSANEYTSVITKLQKDNMRKDNLSLERFTKRFDYNSSDKFSSSTDTALEKSIKRLKGKLID